MYPRAAEEAAEQKRKKKIIFIFFTVWGYRFGNKYLMPVRVILHNYYFVPMSVSYDGVYALAWWLSWLFPSCEGFGRIFNHSARAHRFHPLMPGSVHIGSASWDDCGRMFPYKLRVSSFPDRFPHYAWTAARSAHSDFVGSRVYSCLDVTCYLHFWQNDRGYFTCHCGNTGVERTPNKSQHTKVNPGEEKSPAAPAGIRTLNLSITSRALLPTSYSGSAYLWLYVLICTYGCL